MATYRQIHVKIWSSPDFQELSAHAKLVFIHLFSNSHRNEAALYRITPKTIGNETDLTTDQVKAALSEMEKVGVIKYDWDNYIVWVVNAVKYQKASPNEVKAILKNLQEINHPFVDEFRSYYADILSTLEGTSEVLRRTSEGTGDKGKGKGKDKGNGKGNSDTCLFQETVPVRDTEREIANYNAPITPPDGAVAAEAAATTADNPPKKPKAKAVRHPEAQGWAKPALDYFYRRWQEKYGMKPPAKVISFPRDTKRLIDNLDPRGHPLPLLQQLIDRYFSIRDPFIEQNGHSFGVFLGVIPKLIAEQHKQAPQQEVDLVEAYLSYEQQRNAREPGG